MRSFDELKTLLEGAQSDMEKFEVRKNKAAGVRARLAMSRLAKLTIQVRKDILEQTKINTEEKRKKKS